MIWNSCNLLYSEIDEMLTKFVLVESDRIKSVDKELIYNECNDLTSLVTYEKVHDQEI